MPTRRVVRTPTLEIAYEVSGPEDGVPVILLHGFPDDVRAYDLVPARPRSSFERARTLPEQPSSANRLGR
jgi:pimeloyl-ACP methyl ester carboxylesterase